MQSLRRQSRRQVQSRRIIQRRQRRRDHDPGSTLAEAVREAVGAYDAASAGQEYAQPLYALEVVQEDDVGQEDEADQEESLAEDREEYSDFSGDDPFPQ